jgi:hypothetical protein
MMAYTWRSEWLPNVVALEQHSCLRIRNHVWTQYSPGADGTFSLFPSPVQWLNRCVHSSHSGCASHECFAQSNCATKYQLGYGRWVYAPLSFTGEASLRTPKRECAHNPRM